MLRTLLAHRHPERLASMRAQYAEWEKQFGPVPEDARVSVVYSGKDMPRP